MEEQEFIRIAYEKGKVQEVSQAFEDYPVEEEWHKGKIENVLYEEKIEYGPYRVGDVVFVKQYKYTNGNKGYDHFFVIIAENNLTVPIEFFGMQVSSKLEKLKYKTNILLKKDEENGLDKDSIVKTDVIYRINNEQILFKIGKVDLDKIEEHKRMYLNNI